MPTNTQVKELYTRMRELGRLKWYSSTSNWQGIERNAHRLLYVAFGKANGFLSPATYIELFNDVVLLRNFQWGHRYTLVWWEDHHDVDAIMHAMTHVAMTLPADQYLHLVRPWKQVTLAYRKAVKYKRFREKGPNVPTPNDYLGRFLYFARYGKTHGIPRRKG